MPDQFWAMTAREVSVVIRGAVWRQRQEARRGIITAWRTAAFSRAEKLPDLKSIIRRFDRETEGPPQQQAPEEVWRTLKAIAMDKGLRVTRHEKSVIH